MAEKSDGADGPGKAATAYFTNIMMQNSDFGQLAYLVAHCVGGSKALVLLLYTEDYCTL